MRPTKASTVPPVISAKEMAASLPAVTPRPSKRSSIVTEVSTSRNMRAPRARQAALLTTCFCPRGVSLRRVRQRIHKPSSIWRGRRQTLLPLAAADYQGAAVVVQKGVGRRTDRGQARLARRCRRLGKNASHRAAKTKAGPLEKAEGFRDWLCRQGNRKDRIQRPTLQRTEWRMKAPSKPSAFINSKTSWASLRSW